MYRFNKNNAIAFFDSGIGGLTVLKTAREMLPNENYIYYADTSNAPYGTKSKKEIKKYVLTAIKFLSHKNIKLLVLACNTATSVTINDLRKNFKFPIIGLEPAIKPALKKNTKKKILVLATTLTLQEKKLNNLIKKLGAKNKINKLALDKLVMYAENFKFTTKNVKKYIKQKLNSLKIKDYKTIVLGCTHFIFYKPIIKKLIPRNINIIDGNEGAIKNMVDLLKRDDLLNQSNGRSDIIFYSSGAPETKERISKFKKLLSRPK
jgi:glutamate racemase